LHIHGFLTPRGLYADRGLALPEYICSHAMSIHCAVHRSRLFRAASLDSAIFFFNRQPAFVLGPEATLLRNSEAALLRNSEAALPNAHVCF
jgi:hypothetical protein